MTDSVGKILEDLNSLEASGAEKPSLTPVDVSRWKEHATRLGWDKDRVDDVAEMLLRSNGHLLLVSASIIAMKTSEGHVWHRLRENSTPCRLEAEREWNAFVSQQAPR